MDSIAPIRDFVGEMSAVVSKELHEDAVLSEGSLILWNLVRTSPASLSFAQLRVQMIEHCNLARLRNRRCFILQQLNRLSTSLLPVQDRLNHIFTPTQYSTKT